MGIEMGGSDEGAKIVITAMRRDEKMRRDETTR